MKFNMKKSVLALLLGMTAVSSFAYTPIAPTTYWERTNHGNYSAYSGTRAGGWNLSGATTLQTVYWGNALRCPSSQGTISCSQAYSEAIAYMWTFATAVTYKQTIVPAVADLSVAYTFTAGKTRTYTNTYTINVNPGYRSQYAEVVPRRTGNVTLYGVRVKTGKTKTVRKCKICVQTWTEYEYYNDPNRIATVMYGNAIANNNKLPESTYVVTRI